MNYKLTLNDFISLVGNPDIDRLFIMDAWRNGIRSFGKGSLTGGDIGNQKYRHHVNNIYYTKMGPLGTPPAEKHNFNIIETSISIFSDQIVLLLNNFDSNLEWFNKLNKVYNEFIEKHYGLEMSFCINRLNLYFGGDFCNDIVGSCDWWLDCGDYTINPSFYGKDGLVFVNYMEAEYLYDKFKELQNFI